MKFCDLKQAKLDEAVVAAKQSGERLGRYLLRCGLVTPEQLCRAIAVQSGLPVVNMWTTQAPSSLNRLFPFDRFTFHQRLADTVLVVDKLVTKAPAIA